MKSALALLNNQEAHPESYTDYDAFLARKRFGAIDSGFKIEDSDLHHDLFPHQRDIIKWAIRRGRAAIFADTGLGKTAMELEFARLVFDRTGQSVLILAPLAVSHQTVREGRERWGIEVKYLKHPSEMTGPGIYITNYERLHHFAPDSFGAVILDESSILKSYSSVYRQEITEFASSIPYRLAATATPAPNDLVEIINHAEFLGVMQGKEIIALFFTQDGNTTHAWRLKGHAKAEYWKWMATWSVALRKPSDIGHSDSLYRLPELRHHQVTIDIERPTLGGLFAIEAVTMDERRTARRESMPERVLECARIVNATDEPFLVWCDLNAESEALVKTIPGAVEIRGSDDVEVKADRMKAFSEGRIRVLVSKASICGFGMNWQHCRKMAFVGLSDSFEQVYQATRRCWRFGQTKPVDVYYITASTEGRVLDNIKRKERQARDMMDSLISEMHDLQLDASMKRDEMSYQTDKATGRNWMLYLGDSVDVIDRIESNSVGMSIFSPPFPSMYAYTNSPRDIGNSNSINEFMEHFRHLVLPDKLQRVLMPGRLACVHLMQLAAMKSRDGYIGIKDYRGRTIQMMEEEGWIYAGEVTIDKNPQVQAVRNKERGLLFKTLATDSSLMRMALADYLLYFRKPGENPSPIHAGISPKYNPSGGWITEEEWIEWASPVWYRHTKDRPGGIRETDVLNVAQARETDDERHLCPLQLGVIERAVKLWSAPGETIFSPFNGIGSEGYQSLLLNRKYIGIELKRSYWQTSIRNLQTAEQKSGVGSLFETEES